MLSIKAFYTTDILQLLSLGLLTLHKKEGRDGSHKQQTPSPESSLINLVGWQNGTTLYCSEIQSTHVEGSHPGLRTKTSPVVALNVIPESLGF